ncbi:MAG: cysteine desulfurase [Patescibacteria group bacterium]|nr:cysteine desulfurase [Patescibacteria group bacterium]
MSIRNIKKSYPIFSRRIHGHPLTYLDSAATAQKPTAVLAAMDAFYRRHNANPRRGLYQLGVEATEMVEQVRSDVAAFIGADDASEVVFTSGTTGAINLVAYTWALAHLRPGDEVIVSELEHHSNLVPWQQLAARRRWKLSFIPITANGNLDLQWLRRHLTRRVKLVSVTHTSNVLGVRPPLPTIIRLAHRVGARVLVDAAQAVAHEPINVSRLGCDWISFSGHKMYGPTGIGVLWGRRALLEDAPPYQYGGEMVAEVRWGKTTFADPPARFEAGTQNAAGIVGLGAAIAMLRAIGWPAIRRHERALVRYAMKKLTMLSGVTVYGPHTAVDHGAVISFNIDGVHAHDVASVFDTLGIAVRAGHHCAMPLHTKLGVLATVRASIGIYNTKEDIDQLVRGIKKVQKIFEV